jgi:hypothetical protein
LRGGLRRKYLKTGKFSRKNVRTKRLIFEIPAFRRVSPVFFDRNLRWNGRDQWSVVSGQVSGFSSQFAVHSAPGLGGRERLPESRVNGFRFPGVDSFYYDEMREDGYLLDSGYHNL